MTANYPLPMVLLTGFEPFNGLQHNPAQVLVQAIAQRHQAATAPLYRLVTAILPVEFRGAAQQMRTLLQTHQPDVAISLGVAVGRTGIHLEQLAHNLDNATIPDNAGEQRQQQEIAIGGSPTYASPLPLVSMQRRVAALKIPVSLSKSAGNYVCNHVFYTACHYGQTLLKQPQCGFIHVPAMTEQLPELQPDTPHLGLAEMVQAIELCLRISTIQSVK